MPVSSICWYALAVAITLRNLADTVCGEQWVTKAALRSSDLLAGAVGRQQGGFMQAVWVGGRGGRM